MPIGSRLSGRPTPAVLAWPGPRIDAGPLPWRRSRRRAEAAHDARTEIWRRWGRWVWRHPVLVLLTAGVPLLLLALHAPRMRTGLPDGDWLPAEMESTAAVKDLRAMGRSGLVQQVRVLVHLPEEAFALGAESWDALRRAEEALAADPRVARVQSLRGVAGDRADDLAYVCFLPGFLSTASSAASATPGSEAEEIRELQEELPAPPAAGDGRRSASFRE